MAVLLAAIIQMLTIQKNKVMLVNLKLNWVGKHCKHLTFCTFCLVCPYFIEEIWVTKVS